MKLSVRMLKNPAKAWRSLPNGTRRRILIVVLLLGGGNLIVLAHVPLLTRFAYCFRSQDNVIESDAILVLLGSFQDRSTKAAELYNAGSARVILICQAESAGSDETRYNCHVLMSRGVPKDAIQILPGGNVGSTHDEALRLRDYVRAHPIRRITVVTTAYHTARSRWTLRRALDGPEIDVRMVASEDPRFTEADWYTSRDGLKIYLWEAMAGLYYRLVY